MDTNKIEEAIRAEIHYRLKAIERFLDLKNECPELIFSVDDGRDEVVQSINSEIMAHLWGLCYDVQEIARECVPGFSDAEDEALG